MPAMRARVERDELRGQELVGQHDRRFRQVDRGVALLPGERCEHLRFKVQEIVSALGKERVPQVAQRCHARA